MEQFLASAAELGLNFGVPYTIIGFLVVYIVRTVGGGNWVPRPTYEDMKADRDSYRDTTRQQDITIDRLTKTVEAFTHVYGSASLHVMQSIPVPDDNAQES